MTNRKNIIKITKEAVVWALVMALTLSPFSVAAEANYNAGGGTLGSNANYAIVIGADDANTNTVANGSCSVAVGALAVASGDYSSAYGFYAQATGGYSICVRDCYLTTNAVVFDTELIGPRKGEVTNASPSCPYIVIQVKNQDKSIIFE